MEVLYLVFQVQLYSDAPMLLLSPAKSPFRRRHKVYHPFQMIGVHDDINLKQTDQLLSNVS